MSRKASGILKDPTRAKPFRARYVDAYGVRRSKRFEAESEAKKWLRDGQTESEAIKEALASGAPAPLPTVKLEALLFRDYLATWLKGKVKLAASTRARYEQFAEQLKASWIGKVPADDLNRDHVKRYLDEYAQTYAGNTCLNMLRFLRTATLDMKAERRLLFWACERVFRPKDVAGYTEESPNMLTANQANALLKAIKGDARLKPWHPLVATMLTTGMRFCEVTALKWKDVDFAEGTIRVRRSIYRGQVVERTKTGKNRTPAIIAELDPILQAHYAASPGLPGAWVFPGKHGDPRVTGTLSKPLARALKLAGITVALTPHGLRRTFNELASQNDETGIATRAVTGHADTAMQEHYRQVPAGEKRALQSKAMLGVFTA